MGDFTQQKVITGEYVVEGVTDSTVKDSFWTAETITLANNRTLSDTS